MRKLTKDCMHSLTKFLYPDIVLILQASFISSPMENLGILLNLQKKYSELHYYFLSHCLENQLLQLCTARTVFSMLITVWLYTVMPEMCRWLTNEKQRKAYSLDGPITRCFLKAIKVGMIIEH